MSKGPKGISLASKQVTKLLIVTSIGTLLVGGGLTFIINSRIMQFQTAADNKYAEVSSSQQVTKQKQVTLDNYNQTLGQLHYLETSVQPNAYIPTLLQQLHKLASDNQMSVVSVRPMPAPVAAPAPPPDTSSNAAAGPTKKPAPPSFDTLQISIDVIGTYSHTCAFLYDLTKFPKIISVAGVQLHPGGAIGDDDKNADPFASPKLTANLSLLAYIFHDAPPPSVSPQTNVGPNSTAGATSGSKYSPAEKAEVFGAPTPVKGNDHTAPTGSLEAPKIPTAAPTAAGAYGRVVNGAHNDANTESNRTRAGESVL